MISVSVQSGVAGVAALYSVHMRRGRPWPWHTAYVTFTLERAIAVRDVASHVIRSALERGEPRSTAARRARVEVDRYLARRGWDDRADHRVAHR